MWRRDVMIYNSPKWRWLKLSRSGLITVAIIKENNSTLNFGESNIRVIPSNTPSFPHLATQHILLTHTTYISHSRNTYIYHASHIYHTYHTYISLTHNKYSTQAVHIYLSSTTYLRAPTTYRHAACSRSIFPDSTTQDQMGKNEIMFW